MAILSTETGRHSKQRGHCKLDICSFSIADSWLLPRQQPAVSLFSLSFYLYMSFSLIFDSFSARVIFWCRERASEQALVSLPKFRPSLVRWGDSDSSICTGGGSATRRTACPDAGESEVVAMQLDQPVSTQPKFAKRSAQVRREEKSRRWRRRIGPKEKKRAVSQEWKSVTIIHDDRTEDCEIKQYQRKRKLWEISWFPK